VNPLLRPLAFWTSVLVFLGFTLAAGLTHSLPEDASRLIWVYLGMAASGMAVWSFFPKLENRAKVLLVFGLALVARILMAGFPVSDDVNRYLWEGKLVQRGESPYAHTADSEVWAEHRDSFWDGMNHKDKGTAYPPLVLALFAGLNLISYHPWIYKLIFTLADLATLGAIIALLKRRGLPVRNALIYALNPVIILGFSGEAHFDSLFVFLMLAALLANERGKLAWGWVLLGLSIQIKIISVLLIPLFFWKQKSARCLWILPPLILPSLFFWNDLPNLMSGILHFGGTMSHNGSINHLFIDFFGTRETASRLSMALLALVVLVVSLRARDVLKGSFIIFGALILLSPTIHYWYLSWVLPFVVIFPALPWLVLFALSGFYFIAWVKFGKTGEWYQPIGYLRLQWIPFYVLWTSMFFRGLRTLITGRNSAPVNGLTVVIPVLNESKHLKECLCSLRNALTPVDEIIVVDGGSTDDSMTVAREAKAKVLESKRGRGYQISKGVSASKSEAILILHADAQIAPEIPGKIIRVLNQNPDLAGGAIGQRFVSAKPKPILLLIEALNDFRAGCQGNSFGDQGQFFRRSSLEKRGGYPNIPLMEDVELTTRLKKVGDLVLLDCDLTCSARRWEKEQAFSRILQVLWLVLRYKVLKWFGKDSSEKLFHEYYPPKS
jgi:rSAM/selenodomain-associated transferase 2